MLTSKEILIIEFLKYVKKIDSVQENVTTTKKQIRNQDNLAQEIIYYLCGE